MQLLNWLKPDSTQPVVSKKPVRKASQQSTANGKAIKQATLTSETTISKQPASNKRARKSAFSKGKIINPTPLKVTKQTTLNVNKRVVTADDYEKPAPNAMEDVVTTDDYEQLIPDAMEQVVATSDVPEQHTSHVMEQAVATSDVPEQLTSDVMEQAVATSDVPEQLTSDVMEQAVATSEAVATSDVSEQLISDAMEQDAATADDIEQNAVRSMMQPASGVLAFVTALTWSCLSLTASKLKNPVYGLILATEEILIDLLNDSRVVFAPTLLDIMQSQTPPTLSDFKALPTKTTGRWGVYLLTLEKLGHRPKTYTGSGTGLKDGIGGRWACYDRQTELPHRVKAALEDGYIITHKGLICWAPKPSPGMVFLERVLIKALESFFSLFFWTMESEDDYGMPSLCPWPLDSLPYGGLCSHVALKEGVRGYAEGLSAEQIAAKELEEFTRWQDTREEMKEVFLARSRTSKKKAVDNKTYACHTCGFAFNSQWDLDRHNALPAHIEKVSGNIRPRVNPNQYVWQANNRAMKRYYCKICDRALGTAQQLSNHYKTKTHQNNVKALAEAKSGSGST
jgi:hypothetical protein